ncbi:MAG: hypothetical protein AABX30_00770 [Nanoarchaeota archaeon]
MFTLESLALILAVLVAIKIITIAISPKSWMKFVEIIYKRPVWLAVISLLLSIATLQLLLDNGMTIIQIFAVMLFLVFLSALSVSVYSKEVLNLGKELLRDRNIFRKAWLPILVWLALAIWALWEIFR